MPPAPKDPRQRQRRNRMTTAATLEATPAKRAELPKSVSWHELTKSWWTTIWASPMAEEWVDADVPGLVALAMLVDAFWREPDPKTHAEIRMASREFGLSPLSRRQLQWEIKKLEQRPPAPPAARKRTGRAVLSVLTGSQTA